MTLINRINFIAQLFLRFETASFNNIGENFLSFFRMSTFIDGLFFSLLLNLKQYSTNSFLH